MSNQPMDNDITFWIQKDGVDQEMLRVSATGFSVEGRPVSIDDQAKHDAEVYKAFRNHMLVAHARSIDQTATVTHLTNSGLLFAVNLLLHPHGLAISVQVDETDASKAIRLSNIVDNRNDPEGIRFDEEAFRAGLLKLIAYLDTEGDEKLDRRGKLLNYTFQANSSLLLRLVGLSDD